MKKNIILLRLKETARLESLITSGADYEEILKQSQKIDKYIVDEMQKINGRKETKLGIKQ